MHGELIELNERLQKMLNIREHQLRRLREELVNLRGPVMFWLLASLLNAKKVEKYVMFCGVTRLTK